jgi:dTDP-4-amino-4,6-dideoxygalactose transaminase
MRISMDHRFSNSIFRGVSWCGMWFLAQTEQMLYKLRWWDLKPGDEVITADLRFCWKWFNAFATDSVLVDVDLYNMNISIDAIRKQLHPKQTIVPVHLFGRAANMEAIMAIAKSITYT